MTEIPPQLLIEGAGDELCLAGELDMRTAGQLDRAVDASATPGARLRLDLAAVSFCDSAGLSALVRADRALTAAGGRLLLVNPSARVRRVLDLTGLTEVLTIVDTVDGRPG